MTGLVEPDGTSVQPPALLTLAFCCNLNPDPDQLIVSWFAERLKVRIGALALADAATRNTPAGDSGPSGKSHQPPGGPSFGEVRLRVDSSSSPPPYTVKSLNGLPPL